MKIATLVLVLGASSVLAQTSPALEGTFSSKGAAFEIAGGIAFNGRSAFDPDTPVIIVAISNSALETSALADFVDRKRALEKLVRDDETAVVYLEFTPQGGWRGLSYYFAPGNGCGYCTSEVASTVKLANGRLTGTLKGTEADRPFDVRLDIHVMSDDHGPALPPDGGAPGKAYLAYHAALAAGNSVALKPTLSPGNLEVYERAGKNDDLAGYVTYLAAKHPIKSVTITKAWARPNKASLLVEGESAAGKVSGEVFLVKVGDAWGVDEELVDLVIGR